MITGNDKGKLGEKLACDYLVNKGYKIVTCNFSAKVGEIDIVAQNDIYLVFAEVKTRRKNSIATPAEAVNSSKQRKIIKTALIYMMKNKTDKQPRFDVIEVYMHKSNTPEIYHIENAFILGDDYAVF